MSDKITYSILGLGAGLLIGYQASKLLNKKDNLALDIDQLKQQKKQQKKEAAQNQQPNKNYSSEEYKNMIQEQLVRNIQFFGEEGQQKIQDSYVIIFGVGGVGSHVASSLARSGVGHIKIIDFDQVSLSSLNRHAFATQADVGRSKCECVKDYIGRIVPQTRVDIVEDYVTKDNVESFFKDLAEDGKTILQPTYVVDCIDNIDAKVALLAYCKLNNKKVISSMGAGMKADPTRIQIRDISETNYDDLSRAVRTKLKKYKVHDGIKVVLSVERNERELLPLKDHQETNPEEYKVFSNYRLRIVPVLGTMPALVAYALSSYVLCDLAGQLYKPFPIDEVKMANYAKLFNNLQQEARKIGTTYEDLEFDMEDVYIVAREIYDWKEVVTDKKVCGGLLVRWNPELPFNAENFVLLNFQDAKKHSSFSTYAEVQSAYTQETLQKVEEKKKFYKEFIQKKPVIYK